jgi:hypothetical protein
MIMPSTVTAAEDRGRGGVAPMMSRFIENDLLRCLEPTTKLVIAGRHPLTIAWATGSAWATVLHRMSLAGFSTRECRDYLDTGVVWAIWTRSGES